jgi:hypothetical protein
MPAKRKLKPRPTYRQHAEAVINQDIKRACAQGTIFFDYLTEERLVENFGQTEWERGVIEGGRRFAGRLQDIAMDEIKVEG